MRTNKRIIAQWNPVNSTRHLGMRVHRHSLSLTRTLSVCLKLKGLVDSIESRQAKHVQRLSYLPSTDQEGFKRYHHTINPHEDYNSRTLAEPLTDPLFIDEHRYPSLRALKTDEDVGDGLWLCCHCRHENILRHYRGRFPFKHLTCNHCDRTLCSECQTTEILSPLPYGMIHAPQPLGESEVRYLHICTRCGLSHRAEMTETTLDFYGITCAACGVSSYGDWPRYHIGSVEPYRRDPDASYVRLVERKAERAGFLARRCSQDERAASRLSCKNPD